MSQVDRIINRLSGEIGTTENPPNSNRTKYGQEYCWNGVPWCVQFIWWGFAKEKMQGLFYGGKKTASCSQLKAYAEKTGLWVTSDYKRGDLVIMDFPGNSSRTDHIGIVEAVNGNVLVTIEGNTSSGNAGSQNNGGGVYRRERDMNRVKIVGAYRPKYKGDDKMTGEEIYKALNDYLKSRPVPEWAEEEYNEAIEMGITDGHSPMCLVPRYQAAIMAKRAIEEN